MKILDNLETLDLSQFPRPHVLTLGTFDGVHLGHRRIIERVIEKSHSGPAKGTSIVFTFRDHPLAVLAPPYAPPRLTSAERKAEILREMAVDVLVQPDFTASLSQIGPQQLIDNILIARCRIDAMVVGFDFRFGRQGQGDTMALQAMGAERGFPVEVAPPLRRDEWIISSTRIRELIREGRVRLAGEMLGRPYDMDGRVIHGHGRGRTLGFPTANIAFDPSLVQPPSGVYAVRMSRGGKLYNGMMNIGCTPTFQDSEYRAEVFLFDFSDASLYGEEVRVFFIERLREERKFASGEDLIQRLTVDEKLARAILQT